MSGWFERIKQGLSRTAAPLVSGIGGLLTKKKLDRETLNDIEDLLIMADVGMKTAAALIAELAKEKFDKEVDSEEIRSFFADRIAAKLEPYARELKIDPDKKPFVILMAGVNGAGKTTTIGKLAHQYKKRGLKVRFAAADTFRAAAVEQLKVWGERTECPVVSRPTGADAAGLVFDALAEARKNTHFEKLFKQGKINEIRVGYFVAAIIISFLSAKAVVTITEVIYNILTK